MSTRSLGNVQVREGVGYVSDMHLLGVDIVGEPSSGAFCSALREMVENKRLPLNESAICVQLLKEAAPRGNSLAGADRNQFDLGPYGFKFSKHGDFSRDSATYHDRCTMDTNKILAKILQLQNKPEWTAQDNTDASSLRSYIAQVESPFERQKLYQAWGDAIGSQKMRARAMEFLSRWGKYNR
jgi:hypothetical protein